jgi:hypothetical protein
LLINDFGSQRAKEAETELADEQAHA